MARVAVLVSGGVDSAGAALLLKRLGHDVEGFTARFLDAEGVAPEGAAREICHALGIPHTIIDLRSEFRREVLRPFASGYIAGKTPNPCAGCNRDIKLGILAALLRGRGFEFVATGHYARVVDIAGRDTLCEPADRDKSQVYFLSLVKPEVLGFLLLPLGEYRKGEVRGLIDEAGVPDVGRDSQDLCFVKGTRYHDVLRREGYVFEPGDVLDTAGNVIGTHRGHAAYTPGQRFGSRGRRRYVIEKHAGTNTIVVGERHQALRSDITVGQINWFQPLPGGHQEGLMVRHRYNAAPVGARIEPVEDGRLRVTTTQPCFAPAPGQVLAGYVGDCLTFGGIIE
jgi:tRNA-specific 2-thiouridylase